MYEVRGGDVFEREFLRLYWMYGGHILDGGITVLYDVSCGDVFCRERGFMHDLRGGNEIDVGFIELFFVR